MISPLIIDTHLCSSQANRSENYNKTVNKAYPIHFIHGLSLEKRLCQLVALVHNVDTFRPRDHYLDYNTTRSLSLNEIKKNNTLLTLLHHNYSPLIKDMSSFLLFI